MPIRLQSQLVMRIAIFVGVMTGLAIPLRAPGVAIEQGALGLAFIGSLVIAGTVPDVHRRIRDVLFSPVGLSFAVMFACWTVSVVFSFNPLGSMRIGGRTAALLVASVVLWATLKENAGAHGLMLKALVLSSLAIALGVLLQLNGVAMKVDNPVITNKAFAASAMCLIPVVVWAGRKLDGKWRWLGYSFAPLALGIIVQTFNRAALAGFLAMVITAALLLVLNKHRYAKVGVATLLVGVLGVLVFIFTKELHTPPVEDLYLPRWLVDPHRQYIWKFAFNSFLEHPWLGNGIDQSNYIPGSDKFAPGFDGHTALLPSHPHNGILEILAETGLVGFLPFIFALGFVVWTLIKRCLASYDEGDVALLTLMVGFWSSALFNFSIWSTWWLLTLFTLFVIIAAGRHSSYSE